MRPDLAKLTTEHERVSGSGVSHKYGGRVRIHPDPDHDYPDEYGGFWSSARRRRYGWNYKEFTDVLGPLYGTVRKNLGRPWDKVYSEFCQVLDRRSVAGYHIWAHLMQIVEVHAYMGNDGRVYCKRRYSYGPVLVDGFYVHPMTGVHQLQGRQRNR